MINSGPDKIYVKELKEKLGFTDTRSIKRYCSLNGIAFLRDNGCRSWYVMHSDYEAARLKAFIKHLKEQHGNGWLQVFHAHVEFNLEYLTATKGTKAKEQLKEKKEFSENKKGRNEQRFLDAIINLSVSS